MKTTPLVRDVLNVPKSAAWLAVTGGIVYQALLVLLIFMRPDLNPTWHSVSEWAIGPHGWIVSVAFLTSSISYLALFIVLQPHLQRITGRIGLGLLLICAAGVAGTGIFTTDPMPFHPPLSLRGTLHILCGTIQLILFPVASLIVGLSLARGNRIPAESSKPLLWVAWLPMVGFLCFATYTILFVVPIGPHAYGPGVNIGWPPRFAFLTYSLWVVIVGGHAIRYRWPLLLSRRSLSEGRSNAQAPCMVRHPQ